LLKCKIIKGLAGNQKQKPVFGYEKLGNTLFFIFMKTGLVAGQAESVWPTHLYSI